MYEEKKSFLKIYHSKHPVISLYVGYLREYLGGITMYPYTNYYDALFRQNEKLISDIEKAINGEYSAINCYEKLANLAANEKEKNQINEIRQDEVKHFQQFVQLYTRLTGRQPQPKITEECPDVYLSGLEFALQDEQETVDFYLEIADVASEPSIKEAFRRAAADEQNHAVWFLYYFSKNK
jgi:rubrerythrin